MKMYDCPKFDGCSAPVCPLHEARTTHLRGEPICFYLRELVKTGGKARLLGYIPREMVDTLEKVLPEIVFRHGDIKKGLKRAASSGSKIEAFRPKPGEAA